MIVLPEYYKNLSFEAYSSTEIDTPYGLNSQMYLEFSLVDMEKGNDDRANINAMSNAKRGLHFQIELLSKAFGIEKFPKRKRLGFHNQLSFCQKCGLASPNILRKLNKLRNLAEHEYYIPNRCEVEDFVDIVKLFVSATDRFRSKFPDEIVWSFSEKVDDRLPDLSASDFPPHEGVVYLLVRPDKENLIDLKLQDIIKWQRNNSIQIAVTDGDAYFKWVQFIVKNCF